MRMRSIAIAAVIICSAAGSCFAEAWVAKMIQDQNHDFGTVARGADTVHRFEIKNIYKQDIELAGVRSSCGCTSPSLEGKILKTGDVGYVVAKFNTRTFTGMHGATLTVEVRWNDNGIMRRGETQLRVNGNIRGDVVFEPGAIRFDNIDQGAPAEQQVQVTFAGRSNWRIVDVRGVSDDFEVELTEKQRYSGRVAYELLVRLKDTAAAGYFNDQLVLVTNDQRNPRIPLHVAGRIVPQISVAPERIFLGEVAKGKQVSKKVIVRGKKPFRILSVESDTKSFQFKTDENASERHFVEIIFDADRDPGSVEEAIHIATDMGEGFQATLTAYATVVPSETEAPAVEAGTAAGEPGDSAASRPRSQVASQ
jgi:Protein of unknown function (DUF1573)